MILFAIEKNKLKQENLSATFIRLEKLINIEDFNENEYDLFPWFLIYNDYLDFFKNFKEFIIKNSHYEYLLKRNSLKFKEYYSFQFFRDKFYKIINQTKTLINSKIYQERKKNKAEYTICYSSEYEAFNDLLSKILAKLSGNDHAAKELARNLVLDVKGLLFENQKIIIRKLMEKIDEKTLDLNKDNIEIKSGEIKNKIDINIKNAKNEEAKSKIEQNKDKSFQTQISSYKLQLLNEAFNEGEYFKYFKDHKDSVFSKNNVKKLRDLINSFLDSKHDKIKLNINLIKEFPLVAIGAIIINDLRKLLKEHSPNSSKVYIDIYNIKEIEREKSKFNKLGRASYNLRTYQFEKTEIMEKIDLISARNKFYHENGLTLGNGISGHIVGIIHIFKKYCALNDFDERVIQATIASSMFLFWSLYYDKASTSSHSYIEVFEAISIEVKFDQNNYNKFDVKNPFYNILTLSENKIFNAIHFLDNYKRYLDNKI